MCCDRIKLQSFLENDHQPRLITALKIHTHTPQSVETGSEE